MEETSTLLSAAYQVEVESRQRVYIADEDTVSNIKHFAKFLTSGNKDSVMFCGLCGNGKTTLLYAFQNALNLLIRLGMFSDNINGIQIIESNSIAQLAKNHTYFDALIRSEMIAIEDLGREPRQTFDYGNIITPVTDILEYRYNKRLFTAITTNLTPKQISETYGKRLADRFNEMLEVIIFHNSSYRR